MTLSETINDLFKRTQWTKARKLLEQRLEADPKNHWLLTRLGTTYYEQRNYRKAMELTKQAHAIAPRCLLVLWDLASTYEMLDDDSSAAGVYREIFSLARKGNVAEEHNEGKEWLFSLLTDCLYSASGVLLRLDRTDRALWFIQQHFKWRAGGAKSIYSLKEARRQFQRIIDALPAKDITNGIGEADKMLANV